MGSLTDPKKDFADGKLARVILRAGYTAFIPPMYIPFAVSVIAENDIERDEGSRTLRVGRHASVRHTAPSGGR